MSDLTGLLHTFGTLCPADLSQILGSDPYPRDGLRDSVKVRALVGIYNELREIRYHDDEENPRTRQELRDQFAMAALSGMLSSGNPNAPTGLREATEAAYEFADAMLAAREAK